MATQQRPRSTGASKEYPPPVYDPNEEMEEQEQEEEEEESTALVGAMSSLSLSSLNLKEIVPQDGTEALFPRVSIDAMHQVSKELTLIIPESDGELKDAERELMEHEQKSVEQALAESAEQWERYHEESLRDKEEELEKQNQQMRQQFEQQAKRVLAAYKKKTEAEIEELASEYEELENELDAVKQENQMLQEQVQESLNELTKADEAINKTTAHSKKLKEEITAQQAEIESIRIKHADEQFKAARVRNCIQCRQMIDARMSYWHICSKHHFLCLPCFFTQLRQRDIKCSLCLRDGVPTSDFGTSFVPRMMTILDAKNAKQALRLRVAHGISKSKMKHDILDPKKQSQEEANKALEFDDYTILADGKRYIKQSSINLNPPELLHPDEKDVHLVNGPKWHKMRSAKEEAETNRGKLYLKERHKSTLALGDQRSPEDGTQPVQDKTELLRKLAKGTHSPLELRRQGVTLAFLVRHNRTLDFLLNAGYPLENIRFFGVKTFSDLKSIGLTYNHLRTYSSFCYFWKRHYGMNITNIVELCDNNLKNLAALGYTAQQLADFGCSVDYLMRINLRKQDLQETFTFSLQDWVNVLGLNEKHLAQLGLTCEDSIPWTEEDFKRCFNGRKKTQILPSKSNPHYESRTKEAHDRVQGFYNQGLQRSGKEPENPFALAHDFTAGVTLDAQSEDTEFVGDDQDFDDDNDDDDDDDDDGYDDTLNEEIDESEVSSFADDFRRRWAERRKQTNRIARASQARAEIGALTNAPSSTTKTTKKPAPTNKKKAKSKANPTNKKKKKSTAIKKKKTVRKSHGAKKKTKKPAPRSPSLSSSSASYSSSSESSNEGNYRMQRPSPPPPQKNYQTPVTQHTLEHKGSVKVQKSRYASLLKNSQNGARGTLGAGGLRNMTAMRANPMNATLGAAPNALLL